MSGDEAARIAEGYRRFARVEAADPSPAYARLAEAVADDEEILAFLAAMPTGKRQPNLLFATLQFLHGSAPPPDRLRATLLDDAERVRATMLARATQTNEAARCTALLPLLSLLDGPLALIEVGSSAGLCLYPDRYSYDYDGVRVGGDSAVRLRCTTTGSGPVPRRLPEVVARIGVDLNSLDPGDPEVRAWLRALIWPGDSAPDRLARLDAAAEIAAADPPRLLRGDLVEMLPGAVERAPAGSTVVVFHTAVMPYVPRRTARWAHRLAAASLTGSVPRPAPVRGPRG